MLGIHLRMDKQEMDIENKRAKPCPANDLLTRSRQLCQKAVETSYEKHSIYAQALRETALKCTNSAQKDILLRI